MDAFVNKLDPGKFRQTNGLWNDLMLNDPWSVGYVTTLIALKNFQSKEEWEEFYYQMGEYRQKKLKDLNPETVALLNDEQLIRGGKAKLNGLTQDQIGINMKNGRTKEELKRKGQILYDNIKENHSDISLDECSEAVRYRVICETWNGVVLREKNTIKLLRTKYPKLQFKSTSGDFDHKYAVDYQVYFDSKLICGIQIKPKSYTYNTPYINKAKLGNRRKFQEYSKDFSVPVLTIISKTNGEVIPTKDSTILDEFLQKL